MNGISQLSLLNQDSSVAHLTQLFLALFVDTYGWFTLKEAAAQVSQTTKTNEYAAVGWILKHTACVLHDGKGPGSRLQKTHDPRDFPDEAKPGPCNKCHYASGRAETCLILYSHQRQLNKERGY